MDHKTVLFEGAAMRKFRSLFLITSILLVGCNERDTNMNKKFRKAIFLHHSTGAHILGPNGSDVSVFKEVEKYNKREKLNAGEQVSMKELAWPTKKMGWNNEWYRWNNIFMGRDVVPRWGLKKFLPDFNNANSDWKKIISKYPVIILKSCFPSSRMEKEREIANDKDLTKKTISNYKTIWRSMVRYFSKHPENYFVIWTNAPLARGATSAESAQISKDFCRWAKDTLARGRDNQLSQFPSNVYVFDFFNLMTDSNGIALDSLVVSENNSHPNSKATKKIAPIFVKETFNAALEYEKQVKK
jgi:hypothetical protein